MYKRQSQNSAGRFGVSKTIKSNSILSSELAVIGNKDKKNTLPKKSLNFKDVNILSPENLKNEFN